MSTQPQTDSLQSAKDAARRTMDHIKEIIDALEEADENPTLEFEGVEHNQDSLLEIIDDMPLSVEVRSGWYAPGSIDDNGPAEYKILMSWGGPAVQIIGSLSEYGEPEDAVIQGQDWFVPWTSINLSEDDETALEAFVSHFYFGQ